MEFDKIAVFGAGTMGHGIAQVCAQADYKVCLYDIDQNRVEAGLARIAANLDKGIARGKVTEADREKTLSNISGSWILEQAAEGAEMVIEAVPEIMSLKKDLLGRIDECTEDYAILATNTSSLSIEEIASSLSDPSRVIGLHFFNPVHIMKLLEIVYHLTTGTDVIAAAQGFAEKIGKDSILVKNVPGFATSRLGVALGMEAIRMLEEGVASAEDIDKAMVLGYRHPIGPLKLTDMIGLDVRMAIGEYLAKELNNPAFEPPELLRRLVSQGKLGKKATEGFYRW